MKIRQFTRTLICQPFQRSQHANHPQEHISSKNRVRQQRTQHSTWACVKPIIFTNKLDVSRYIVTGSDPNTSYVRVRVAPFRTAGREERAWGREGSGDTLWVLVAGKRPGEDVADGAAARLVAARKGREAEKGNGEEETERGRVVGVEQLNAWAMGIFSFPSGLDTQLVTLIQSKNCTNSLCYSFQPTKCGVARKRYNNLIKYRRR